MNEIWLFTYHTYSYLIVLHRYQWAFDEATLLAGVKALDAERRRPNFGNAGAVMNLLAAAAVR